MFFYVESIILLRQFTTGKSIKSQNVFRIFTSWNCHCKLLLQYMILSKSFLVNGIISALNSVLSSISAFSEYATIQGIVYIFASNRTVVQLYYWSITVVLLMILGIYWSAGLFLEWKVKPVLTTIQSTGYPINDIEFPSITFCSKGIFI